ncbi:MAG: tetratricopeptide repeat protein [Patescibacteria group bacterium]|jgi:tetratricopeptide (TPR) repeat protein
MELQDYRELADRLRKLDRYCEAEEAYRQIIRLEPMDRDAHFYLGVCVGMQGRYEEAISSFQHVAELATGKEYIQARKMVGCGLINLQRPEEAHAVFSEIVRMQPNWGPLHYYLGLSLHNMGRLEEAIEAYGKSIRLNPSGRDSYYRCLEALQTLMDNKGFR